MLKIRNYSLTYLFLLFMPFVGILAHRLDVLVAYVLIVLFLTLFVFFKSQKGQITNFQFLYALLLIISLYCSFVYQNIYYENSNLYFVQFFGSNILFFLVFSFFVNIKRLDDLFFIKISIFIVLLIFLFVLLDYIFIKFGLNHLQLMYKPDAHSYSSKPMGLFGQFSINSTYSVFFYLVYLGFKKNNYSSIKNLLLFLVVTATIILQNSGSGFLAYILLLCAIFYKFRLFRFFIAPIGFMAIILIVQQNIIQKLSYDYLLYLYEYFLRFLQEYISSIKNPFDFLFGNGVGTIDFGPFFIIGNVGFVYFILFSIMLFYAIIIIKNRYLRFSIIVLMVSNLHYPAFFYPLMNVFLTLMVLYICFHERTKIHKEVVGF
ncbi:hypothetical protein [Aliarcobacter cryaerophilus]|uniref:hypothetical protein n=1 Tax=Aliarcobacter cryaerophilus TaxID=28198 RepID=UPI0011DF79A3|nr:hypothetical protein [Aliarcobacter cryaerophilus]